MDKIMAILEQMKNDALNKIIVGAMDGEMATATEKLLRCCNEHGVSTDTVMEIAMAMTKDGDR